MTTGEKTILITGATGLLGYHAIECLQDFYDVHAVVRSVPDSRLNNRIQYHSIDFSGTWSTRELPKKINTVIHLAQSAHFRKFPEMALDIFRVNVDSTARLLDYARQAGAERFIYASSGGIYGSGSSAFDENAPVIPSGQLGYYLGSKLCGEVLVENYAALMNIVILRFFFMYGRGQNRSMLIPRLIDNLKAGQIITIQGENGIRINPIHVSDAARAMVRVLNLEQSSIFNIAGPEILSIRQIVEIIGDQLNIKPIFEIKDGDPQDLVGDIKSMAEQLHAPQVRLKDGIQDLL